MASHALTPISGTNGHQQQVSIDPSQPLNLTVTNANGEVRISGSNQAGIWIVVRRSDGDKDDAAEIPITVDVEGNHISIHPDWTKVSGVSAIARRIKDQLKHGLNPADWDLSNLRINTDLNYDIRIEVPRQLATGSKINARTATGPMWISGVQSDVGAVAASGAIEIRDITGTVVSSTASGAIRCEKIEGSLEVNTASGSVAIEKGAAWLAARTVSGRIAVDNFTMKNARVATVSGSVQLQGIADNAEEYTVSTVSGSVRLDVTVPATSQATLGFRSASGSGKASGEWTQQDRRSWTLGSGDKGPAFSVKTVSGSLKADGRADSRVSARNEPLPSRQAGDEETNNHHDLHHDEHGVDIEAHLGDLTSWTRDFARDFKAGFTGATAPIPPTPPRPAAPTEPTPPAAPTAPTEPYSVSDQSAQDRLQAERDRAQAERDRLQAEQDVIQAERAREQAQRDAGEPWTPSTSAGAVAPAPESGQVTEPIGGDHQEPAGAGETLTSNDEERLRILEALERGEIDIDEALAKLDPDDAQGA